MAGWLATLSTVVWLAAASLNLLAQGPGTDALAGTAGWAGWVGFLVNGGVLGWLLLKYIPEKDRQAKEASDAKDARVKELIDSRDALVRDLWQKHNETMAKFQSEQIKDNEQRRDDFRASLQLVIDHCERETSAIGGAAIVELRRIATEAAKRGQARGEKQP